MEIKYQKHNITSYKQFNRCMNCLMMFVLLIGCCFRFFWGGVMGLYQNQPNNYGLQLYTGQKCIFKINVLRTNVLTHFKIILLYQTVLFDP